jgi:hypothetical protein
MTSPMRAILIPAAAVTLGLAGGFAWSAWTAPIGKAPAPPRAAFAPIPASPEERPLEPDREWTSRADDAAAEPRAAAAPTTASNVHYSGCNQVRAAGKVPLNAGQPGYRTDMDGDGDGIACEPIRSH